MSASRRARHTRSQRHFLQGITKGPGLGRFRPILPFAIVFAVAGVAVSVALQTVALLDPVGGWGLLAFLLLPGVFLVWPPAILESIRLGMVSRDPTELFPMGADWSQVMRGVPRSVRVVAWTLLAFTLLGAAWLTQRSAAGGLANASIAPPVITMLLYGFSALILISAYRTPPDEDASAPTSASGDDRSLTGRA